MRHSQVTIAEESITITSTITSTSTAKPAHRATTFTTLSMPRLVRCVVVAGMVALSASSFAQSPPRIRNVHRFRNVTVTTVLGEKTENLLAPRFGHIGDAGKSVWAGLTARTREFEESYPVRPACTVSIARNVGEGLVRVVTWDNPVVRVHITATAGAEQAEAAQELVDKLKINVSPSPERVDVSVDEPSVREGGKTAIKLDYEITVPAGASITCKNEWGDTEISGVAGTVEIDSRFGALDLRNIGGGVRARAWGEFPLRAYGLRQGGAFELQGTQSEFAGVSGALKISNFMGSVAVRELPAETELDVTCESGPIELYVPKTRHRSYRRARPSSIASTSRPTTRRSVTARGGVNGSGQRLCCTRVSTRSRFTRSVKPPELSQAREGGELVRKRRADAQLRRAIEISIGAAVGDIRIT